MHHLVRYLYSPLRCPLSPGVLVRMPTRQRRGARPYNSFPYVLMRPRRVRDVDGLFDSSPS